MQLGFPLQTGFGYALHLATLVSNQRSPIHPRKPSAIYEGCFDLSMMFYRVLGRILKTYVVAGESDRIDDVEVES